MMRPLALRVPLCLLAVVAGLFATGSRAVAADLADAAHTARIKKIMAGSLPLLGHRNWIVVADSAYPAQAREAIKTIYIGGDQVAAVKTVLEALGAAPHVQPKIYIDAELEHVPEADAPGIDRYRTDLVKLLGGRPAQREPHIDIIEKLDETAKAFDVLILKTDLTLPYTTVFMELDCRYWNEEKEAKLRAALEKK